MNICYRHIETQMNRVCMCSYCYFLYLFFLTGLGEGSYLGHADCNIWSRSLGYSYGH